MALICLAARRLVPVAAAAAWRVPPRGRGFPVVGCAASSKVVLGSKSGVFGSKSGVWIDFVGKIWCRCSPNLCLGMVGLRRAHHFVQEPSLSLFTRLQTRARSSQSSFNQADGLFYWQWILIWAALWPR
jgi:hypothetical protein